MAIDKSQQVVAPAIDDEQVGQGDGGVAAETVGDFRRLGEGLAARRRVEQIAFQIDESATP